MTKIEWTNETWNPVTGCDKISQGCKFCYAEVMHRRLMVMHPAKYRKPFLGHIELHEDELQKPLKWRKPKMIFVNSMSDLFHKDIPFEFIEKVFMVMIEANWHTFQVLTKRVDRAFEFYLWLKKRYAPTRLWDKIKWPIPNVWVLASCEDQKTANERLPVLMHIEAAVIGASFEPLIGPIDVEQIPAPRLERIVNGKSSFSKMGYLNWAIVGGESGHNARPMHPDWARSLRDQCEQSGVPFFFKQWGKWLPVEFDAAPPFRYFSNTGEIVDGHHVDVVDTLDPLGTPGKYNGNTFMDAMEAIILCEEENATHCDFLKGEKWEPLLDGKRYVQFPTA